MQDFLTTLDPMWVWLVVGLVLLISELMIPGVFMLWLGLAALVTGLIVAVLPIGWELQTTIFVALAVVSVLIGYRISKNRPSHFDTDSSHRFDKYLGLETELIEAIQGGRGRIRVGETSWRVSGPNLPQGQRVKIISVENGELIVDALASDEEVSKA